jgi:phosphoribosyl-dephospho-CoA transferase
VCVGVFCVLKKKEKKCKEDIQSAACFSKHLLCLSFSSMGPIKET